MTVQPTLEHRRAGTDDKWERLDPARREQWQWHDAPDWLAAEALWLMGEGSEVRLVTVGIEPREGCPGLRPEMFGDHTENCCLSLNPPADNPPVPEGATHYGKPVEGAGRPNDPGTGAYVHTTDVPRTASRVPRTASRVSTEPVPAAQKAISRLRLPEPRPFIHGT